MTKRRVGIFGGTFSPPHVGHIHAAKSFLASERPDVLYIIPSHISPGKREDRYADPAERLQMCRLAFGDLPNTEICDIEISRKGTSYTLDTLKAFSGEDVELTVLCGTDTALSLDTWYHPGELFALAQFVCIRRERDGDTLEKLAEKNRFYAENFGSTVRLIDCDPTPISSTEVRDVLLSGGESLHVTPAVAAFIKERGLYSL